MSTIADIASWVTDDVLNRSDLTAVSQNAALDFYRVLTYKVPFDELMTTSAEIPTVQNQAEYDLSALVPTMKAIADVRITLGSQQKRRLRRSHVRVYDALSITTPTYPATYARWGNTFILNPVPDSSSYTFRFRFWKKITVATPIGDTVLEVPDEWDELMRYETLYRVLNYLGQSMRAAILVQPSMLPRQGVSNRRQLDYEPGIIPRLWNDLLTTISAKENVDEDFSINPVVRSYSYRGR